MALVSWNLHPIAPYIMHHKVKDNIATRAGSICDILAEVLKQQGNEGKTLSFSLKEQKKLEIVTKGLSLFTTRVMGI